MARPGDSPDHIERDWVAEHRRELARLGLAGGVQIDPTPVRPRSAFILPKYSRNQASICNCSRRRFWHRKRDQRYTMLMNLMQSIFWSRAIRKSTGNGVSRTQKFTRVAKLRTVWVL
jgi:hypothetical protein